LVNAIILILLSDIAWPKVITLSDTYSKNLKLVDNKKGKKYLTWNQLRKYVKIGGRWFGNITPSVGEGGD
jgi:hypothetical protein